jgi:hypothetical protein
MPQDRTISPPRIAPCAACDRLAGALLEDVRGIGARVARAGEGWRVERVCPTHLPLVVGFTAPRELAKWLWAALVLYASLRGTSAFLPRID